MNFNCKIKEWTFFMDTHFGFNCQGCRISLQVIEIGQFVSSTIVSIAKECAFIRYWIYFGSFSRKDRLWAYGHYSLFRVCHIHLNMCEMQKCRLIHIAEATAVHCRYRLNQYSMSRLISFESSCASKHT